ncbi:MAG: c-type cytochrome [Nitrospinae bacterium]|nr:c-type cytochrome [Nitrospinota bacterium]
MKRFFMVTVFLVGIFISSNALADYSRSFEGRNLFMMYCYLCHGTDGKGNGPLASRLQKPPTNLTDISKIGKRTDDELFGIIEGKKHDLVSDNMPKWGTLIGSSQIKGLVAYVRFLSQSKHPLLGDPEEGKRVYDTYCTACHGKKGKGDGVMMSIIPISPMDHSNAEKMDKLTNEELVNIVITGKGDKSFMPGWQGILSREQIGAVVSYIRYLSH